MNKLRLTDYFTQLSTKPDYKIMRKRLEAAYVNDVRDRGSIVSGSMLFITCASRKHNINKASNQRYTAWWSIYLMPLAYLIIFCATISATIASNLRNFTISIRGENDSDNFIVLRLHFERKASVDIDYRGGKRVAVAFSWRTYITLSFDAWNHM